MFQRWNRFPFVCPPFVRQRCGSGRQAHRLNRCGMENYGWTVNVQGSVVGCAHYVELDHLQTKQPARTPRIPHFNFRPLQSDSHARFQNLGPVSKGCPAKYIFRSRLVTSGHIWSRFFLLRIGWGEGGRRPDEVSSGITKSFQTNE